MTRIRNSEPRIMVGATATEDGVAGYAPTPPAGPIHDALRRDGTYGPANGSGGGGGGAVDSVNGQTGAVVLDTGDVASVADSRYVTDAQLAILALTTASFTTTQATKLAGIATGATANSADATLLARANHTGTQAQNTIDNLVTDLAAKLPTSSLDTDATLAANSDSKIPSQKAVKAYVDAQVGGGDAVSSVNTQTGAVVLDTGDIVSVIDSRYVTDAQLAILAATTASFTTAQETKLAGIATGATANSSDATLLARANHTGTQDADTITDGVTNKAFLATERTKLAGIATAATANSSDATLLDRANHTGTQNADTIFDGTTNKVFTLTLRTKLAGIATGATANSSDATLLDRANHTGTQAQNTIDNLVTDLAAKALDADLDAHTAATNNPHSVTKAQVGLTSVTDDAQTKAAIVPNTAPTAAQILVGNAGGTAYAPVSLSADITITSAGVATIANSAVSNAKMANMAANTVKVNATAGAAAPTDLALAASTFLARLAAGNIVAATVAEVLTLLQGAGLAVSNAGFRGIPQNSQSAAYTMVASDAGKHIYHPAADTTARTWTIPANASVAFEIGTAITFDNDFGAGALTIAITTDTLVLVGAAGSTGSRTIASGGQATAVKVTATRWRISGTGLT